MSDGRNGTTEAPLATADAAPVIPSLNAAPPPPDLPKLPQDAGVWSIPTETAALLRDIDSNCASLLQKIGSLEVDYLAAKAQAVEELRTRRALFKNLVDETARKAGLDIDKQRWNIDTRTMMLVRAS